MLMKTIVILTEPRNQYRWWVEESALSAYYNSVIKGGPRLIQILLQGLQNRAFVWDNRHEGAHKYLSLKNSIANS